MLAGAALQQLVLRKHACQGRQFTAWHANDGFNTAH